MKKIIEIKPEVKQSILNSNKLTESWIAKIPAMKKIVEQDEKLVKLFLEKIDFNGPKILSTPCWIWIMGKTKAGYGRLLYNGVSTYSHRLSWIIFNGCLDPVKKVCHHCDNPACVNPDHLFVGSQQDNIKDMHSKGRQKGNPRKLTNTQVNAIFNDKRPYSLIAIDYGVKSQTICKIKNKKLASLRIVECGLLNAKKPLRSKLTKDQILAIFKDQRTQRAIASDYRIQHGTVGKIKRLQMHSDITKEFSI